MVEKKMIEVEILKRMSLPGRKKLWDGVPKDQKRNNPRKLIFSGTPPVGSGSTESGLEIKALNRNKVEIWVPLDYCSPEKFTIEFKNELMKKL